MLILNSMLQYLGLSALLGSDQEQFEGVTRIKLHRFARYAYKREEECLSPQKDLYTLFGYRLPNEW